jgi:protein SCO1/2
MKRLAVAVALAAVALPARAAWPLKMDAPKPAETQAEVPAALEGVDIVERLSEQVPLDVGFTDSTGRAVKLADLTGKGRPVILTLVYYECPMLCGLVLGAQATAMQKTGLELGKDFDAVTISFDPSENSRLAAERQRQYLRKAGWNERGASWSFMTGNEPEIRRVADAVGFRYSYDEKTKQFAHAAAIMVLTPEGKVSRYMYGVDFPPRDLRLAIVEAAQGRVGTSFDRLLLTCYRYDNDSRGYRPYVMGFIRLGGATVLGGLAIMLGVLWRRELKQRKGSAR